MKRVLKHLVTAAVMLLVLTGPGLPAFAADGDGPASSPPSFGIVARAGYYGVPDWILDLLFEQHPDVDGTIFGGELRYYGEGGPSGVLSVGIGADVGRTDGFGIWQEDAGDVPINGGGEVDIIAGHITVYVDIAPSSPIHPYLGIGGGVGYAEGRYVRDGAEVKVEEFVPVIHLPVGIVLNLGDNVGLSAEARIIDGVSVGGSLQLRF